MGLVGMGFARTQRTGLIGSVGTRSPRAHSGVRERRGRASAIISDR